MKRKIFSILVPLALLAVYGFTFKDARLASSGHDEHYMISIKRFPDWVKPPIEIVGLKVKGVTVESGKFFAVSGPGYFRDLVVTVKNVSERRIVCVEVAIEFARNAQGQPWLAEIDLQAGADYMQSLSPLAPEIDLQPGGTVELTVPEETVQGVEHDLRTIKGLPTSILRRAEIRPTAAYFNKDEMWRGIDYFRRDPVDPSRWKVVTDPQQRRTAIEGSRFKMKKAMFVPVVGSGSGVALTGCGLTVESQALSCEPQYPTCTVVHTCTQDASPGLQIVNRYKRCRYWNGSQWVNCSCTKYVTEVDSVPCN